MLMDRQLPFQSIFRVYLFLLGCFYRLLSLLPSSLWGVGPCLRWNFYSWAPFLISGVHEVNGLHGLIELIPCSCHLGFFKLLELLVEVNIRKLETHIRYIIRISHFRVVEVKVNNRWGLLWHNHLVWSTHREFPRRVRRQDARMVWFDRLFRGRSFDSLFNYLLMFPKVGWPFSVSCQGRQNCIVHRRSHFAHIKSLISVTCRIGLRNLNSWS